VALVTNNISGSSSGFSRIGITGSVVIGDAPQSAFPTPGSDAVFFVSGSESKKTVIGGAAKISGSLSADGNVVLGNAGEDTITVAGTSIFSMPATFNAGISGSLTKLSDGTSYLVAGNNVIITTASNGSITIESSGGGGGGGGAPTGALYVTLATNASLTDERVLTAGSGISIVDGGAGSTVTISTTNGTGADPNAQYLVLSSTGSLNNERTFTAGTGLTGTDGGANSNYVLAINDSVVATVSGTQFAGPISSTGFTLTDRVLISSGSSKTISQAAGLVWENTNNYLGAGVSSPARNIHALAGIRVGTTNYLEWIQANSTTQRFTGGGSTSILEFNNDVLLPGGRTLGFQSSAAQPKDAGFSRAAAGIISVSGSAPGAIFRFNTTSTPLSAGDFGMNVSSGRPVALISGSVRQIAHIDEVAMLTGATFTGNINAQGTGNQFNVLTVTGSAFGIGLNVNQSAFIGGTLGVTSTSTFAGVTTHTAGLSGSLTKLVDGTSYLIAGSGVTITSASNGAVTISSTGGGASGAPTDASYIVLGNNGTLSNERVLTAGSGISITDGGPGGNVTISATGGGAGGGPSYFASTTPDAIFTSGSAAFKGNEFIDSPADKGADVYFYVSGSTTQKALFGGDVRISGSLTVGTGSVTLTSNDIQFGSSTNKIELSGNDLRFYDSSNTSGRTLSALVSGLVPIESKYISSDTQTVTFSNLDGDTDKQYYLIARFIQGSQSTTREIRPNGVSSNVSSFYHIYAGASIHAVGSYPAYIGFGANVASGSYGTLEVIFTADRTGGRYRQFDIRSQYYNTTTPFNGLNIVGRWADSSSNLTSLDIRGDKTDSFVSGSEFHLYKFRRG
jgi:hypothetical protein